MIPHRRPGTTRKAAMPRPKLATICSPHVRRSIERDVLNASPKERRSMTISGTTKKVMSVHAAPSMEMMMDG